MKATALTLGALLATAALLSACSSDSGPGPLDSSGPWGCAGGPAAPGQAVAFGNYELFNNSSSTVTILKVTLLWPHGLAMTRGAWVMPATRTALEIGAEYWPPNPATNPLWPQRRRAAGAQIKPGQVVELVLGVAMTTTATGHSPGPLIAYTAGGHTYALHQYPGMVLGPNGSKPCKPPA